MKFNCITKTK